MLSSRTLKEPIRPHPLDVLPAPARVPAALVLAAIPLSSLYLLASWWRMAPVLAAPLIAPIVLPLLTPLLAQLRVFRYRSRFLLLLPRVTGGFSLHLGTGLDR